MNDNNIEEDDMNEDGQLDSTPNLNSSPPSKLTDNTHNEQGRKKVKRNEEEIEKNENEMGNPNETSERKGATNCTNSKSLKTKPDSVEKASRMKDNSPYNQSVENLYLKKQKRVVRAHQRGATYPSSTNKSRVENEGWNNSTKVEEPKNTSTSTAAAKKSNHTRTSSQPQPHFTGRMKYDNPLFERVRHAKEVAECAIRVSFFSCGVVRFSIEWFSYDWKTIRQIQFVTAQ